MAAQQGKLRCRAGIDTALEEALANVRKQASYFASVSEGNLLISLRAASRVEESDDLVMAPFESGLVAEGLALSVRGMPDLRAAAAELLA